jgi:hypothetical protein
MPKAFHLTTKFSDTAGDHVQYPKKQKNLTG